MLTPFAIYGRDFHKRSERRFSDAALQTHGSERSFNVFVIRDVNEATINVIATSKKKSNVWVIRTEITTDMTLMLITHLLMSKPVFYIYPKPSQWGLVRRTHSQESPPA